MTAVVRIEALLADGVINSRGCGFAKLTLE